ncbi:hypothetical protein GCM10010837_51250 [Aminobacter niigataensis]
MFRAALAAFFLSEAHATLAAGEAVGIFALLVPNRTAYYAVRNRRRAALAARTAATAYVFT